MTTMRRPLISPGTGKSLSRRPLSNNGPSRKWAKFKSAAQVGIALEKRVLSPLVCERRQLPIDPEVAAFSPSAMLDLQG
jgi:hypothetical protein